MKGQHQHVQTPIRQALQEWGQWRLGEIDPTPRVGLVEAAMQSGFVPAFMVDLLRTHYATAGAQKAKYRTMGVSVYYTTKANAEAVVEHVVGLMIAPDRKPQTSLSESK